MNADQLRGRLERVMGKVEEVIGRIVGNRPLMARGKIDLTIGLAREKFGNAKDAVRRRSLLSGPRSRGPT